MIIIILGAKMIRMQEQAPSHLPWTEKYRPKELNTLISHENILKTLNQFAKDNTFPNLIFYGPPGTGKTSTIKAYAKQIYGDSFKRNVLELNASDERGINTVREQIKSFASSSSLTLGNDSKIPKLIVLDEADMMTAPAQFALRRIIQKYYKNVRFCLISNYISKIIPALLSRCTRFKFNPIPYEGAKLRIQSICRQQDLKIDENGVKAVYEICGGDMRKIVNLLQSVSLESIQRNGGQITGDQIYTFTSHPNPSVVKNILDILLNQSFHSAYEKVEEIRQEYGMALVTLIKQLFFLVIELDMDNHHTSQILIRLSDIQYRLSLGCNEKIQLASLVGIFIEMRQLFDNKSE